MLDRTLEYDDAAVVDSRIVQLAARSEFVEYFKVDYASIYSDVVDCEQISVVLQIYFHPSHQQQTKTSKF